MLQWLDAIEQFCHGRSQPSLHLSVNFFDLTFNDEVDLCCNSFLERN
ncbi:MAG: hypothetical protein ACI8SK_000396 [Shewanella sp.]|jgi:hypothetical protein